MSHYSQNDEQDFLLEFFGEIRGKLLDIGAFDGITFSNTRALLEMGWSGYLIEPDPFNIVKLLSNPPPNAEVICAAVGEFELLSHIVIETYAERGWASTIHYKTSDGRVLKPLQTGVIVPTITLIQLVAYGPFDFISIDAEGKDFDIIKTMPLEMLYNASLICVEPKDKDERKEMKDWFASVGYNPVHETPENLFIA